MKPLLDYISEAYQEYWYQPFERLFKQHMDEILDDAGIKHRGTRSVIHNGNNSRPTFTITYTTETGQSGWPFNFYITPEPWGGKHIPTDIKDNPPLKRVEYVNDLIKKNIDKLPKLEFDKKGYIIYEYHHS